MSEDENIEDKVNATDSAIALAKQHNIDLSEVEGSGSEGRILKSDVEVLIAPAPKPDPVPEPEVVAAVVEEKNTVKPEQKRFDSACGYSNKDHLIKP